MINIKHLCMATMLLIAGTSVMAQSETKTDDGKDYKPYPYMFVNVQGGMQTTLTRTFTQSKLITQTVSGSFGAFFTPVVGARLHVNGGWNKGGVETVDGDKKYSYNYVTTNLDLMLNMVTMFGKKDYYPLNVYLIGGIGLNTAFNNDDAWSLASQYVNTLGNAWEGTKLSHNARVGVQLDWNVAKHWSVNAEFDANSLNDRYNSKKTSIDDWSLTCQLGVTYKFGYKKKPVPQEVWETRIDTVWYDDTEYKDVSEDGSMTWNVFYNIRESDFGSQIDNTADAQLKSIGEFLKDHKECKVKVESYSDVQTGNPKINMQYSKARNENAVKALTDAGVSSDIITTGYYGDTVQPFGENDKNRCTIIKATGLKDVKVPYTVKKFRTEETRVRVQ